MAESNLKEMMIDDINEDADEENQIIDSVDKLSLGLPTQAVAEGGTSLLVLGWAWQHWNVEVDQEWHRNSSNK